MSQLYPLAVCSRSFEEFALLEAAESSLVRCWHLNSYKGLVVANSNADRYHRWVKREFLGGRRAEVRAAAAARSRLCGGSPMLARSPSTQE